MKVVNCVGGVLSPLLGNIYLHHVLDMWFEREVKPRMKGSARLIRYADDFVICFELHADAERVMKVLSQRMAKYGLTLHPGKTRLLEFRPPTVGGGGGPTFDFLGFTIHWAKTRRGRWRMGCRTRRARIRRAIKSAIDWCRRHRHQPVAIQHTTLTRKLRGHYNYFGVNGNMRCLQMLLQPIKRGWKRWLGRRSQRGYMSWERFAQLLRRYPLPAPRITVQIWGT